MPVVLFSEADIFFESLASGKRDLEIFDDPKFVGEFGSALADNYNIKFNGKDATIDM
jgi:hypothetical protein